MPSRVPVSFYTFAKTSSTTSSLHFSLRIYIFYFFFCLRPFSTPSFIPLQISPPLSIPSPVLLFLLFLLLLFPPYMPLAISSLVYSLPVFLFLCTSFYILPSASNPFFVLHFLNFFLSLHTCLYSLCKAQLLLFFLHLSFLRYSSSSPSIRLH